MDMLLEEVEKKREELNKLVNQYGLSDERVLLKSRELDGLLNQYFHKKKKVNPLYPVPELRQKFI